MHDLYTVASFFFGAEISQNQRRLGRIWRMEHDPPKLIEEARIFKYDGSPSASLIDRLEF
jgi:hypothetical protein